MRDPALIFVVLAVLFALVNLVLWVQVFRSPGSSGGNAPHQGDSPKTPENLEEILERLLEQNRRVEDQLWGVLDRLKEIETGVGEENEED